MTMSFNTSEAAALLTAAVLSQQKVPMTKEGAEQVALFHKHMVYFLDLHLWGASVGSVAGRGAREDGR
jgi:hypothetical protein